MNMRERINVSDLIVGKIYKYIYTDEVNNFEIFRYSEDSGDCPSLEVWNKNFFILDINNKYTIYEPTKEECMWYEYCESLNKYRPQEEALEHMYAKEFVKEYLTEE